MKVKSVREVTQSWPTLSDPMDCSLPGSSIHGIFQARVLAWGAIASSEIFPSIRVFSKESVLHTEHLLMCHFSFFLLSDGSSENLCTCESHVLKKKHVNVIN